MNQSACVFFTDRANRDSRDRATGQYRGMSLGNIELSLKGVVMR